MHWSLKDHEHSKWGKWILNAPSKKCISTFDNYIAQLIYVKKERERKESQEYNWYPQMKNKINYDQWNSHNKQFYLKKYNQIKETGLSLLPPQPPKKHI